MSAYFFFLRLSSLKIKGSGRLKLLCSLRICSELLSARPLSSGGSSLANQQNSWRHPSMAMGALRSTERIACVAQALFTICLAKKRSWSQSSRWSFFQISFVHLKRNMKPQIQGCTRLMRSSSSREQTSSTWTEGAPIFLTSSVNTPGSDSIVHHQLNIAIQIFIQSDNQRWSSGYCRRVVEQQGISFIGHSKRVKQQDQCQNQQQPTMAYYQNHRLSIKSATTLANLLVQCLLLNQTIQSYRQVLAKTPYYDTLALFRFLDRNQKGFICEKDIHKIIGTSHRKLLTYAFSWMDNLKVGEISRFQFAAFLLPREDLELREIVAQRLQHPQVDHCQAQTILQQYGIFRQLVLEIIKRQMKLIELRRNLLSSDGYSSKGVIMAIDSSRHDWVTIQDIFKFIKNYGFDVTLRQVERLVEILNFKIDGKVTQEQLKWAVEGFEGPDKHYLNRIKISNKKRPPQKPIHCQQSFAKHIQEKAKNGQIIGLRNPIEGIYRQLSEKRRLIETEERELDKNLELQLQLSQKFNRAQYQKERINLQFMRQMQASRKARERQEWAAKKERQREIQRLIIKTSALEAETERLARLQKKLSIAQDTARIQKTIYAPNYQYSAPGYILGYPLSVAELSFGEDLSQFYQLRQSRNESRKKHLQRSQAYLKATRQLRDQIKRQREIQKGISQEFRFNSDRTYGFLSSETDQTYKGQKRVEQITLNGIVNKVPGQLTSRKQEKFKEAELGLYTKQKNIQAGDNIQSRVSINHQEANVEKSEHNPYQFETPQQKQDIHKGVYSTTNKI